MIIWGYEGTASQTTSLTFSKQNYEKQKQKKQPSKMPKIIDQIRPTRTYIE